MTSDAETRLLRRASDRATSRDVSDQRLLSRDTFYSSTATDRFRLSTGSDGASARRQSSGGDDCYSPEVFQTTASESSCVVVDQSQRVQNSDAARPSLTVMQTDASSDDVNPVFDAPRIGSSLLLLNKPPLLRFVNITWPFISC